MNETEKVLPKPSAKRDCTIIQVSLPLQGQVVLLARPICLHGLGRATGNSAPAQIFLGYADANPA